MGRKAVIQRGEIWTADLRSVGGEISKIRPALIVSANVINDISPIIIVIPLSSIVPGTLGPERILVEKINSGLTKDSVALTTQIRALEKRKLVKRVSKLNRERMNEIEVSMKVVLELLDENGSRS